MDCYRTADKYYKPNTVIAWSSIVGVLIGVNGYKSVVDCSQPLEMNLPVTYTSHFDKTAALSRLSCKVSLRTRHRFDGRRFSVGDGCSR